MEHLDVPFTASVCATALTGRPGRPQDLTGTMRMVCEILSSEPAGGSAAIPYTTFERIYKYLASADGSVRAPLQLFCRLESGSISIADIKDENLSFPKYFTFTTVL